MKTFPQPLEAEEEQYYLQRLKEGDGQARDILVERNLRLVAHIVKKYQGAGEETEDLIPPHLVRLATSFINTSPVKTSSQPSNCQPAVSP